MTSITLLGEAQLRELVPLDLAAIDQVEAAFLALATEDVAMPPILRLDLPAQNGEVDVKTAYLPRFDSFAIKVSPGFFNNPALGLPSLNGLMLVLSAKTGLTEAVLLDNGYLTAVRTAAAGAVAAHQHQRLQLQTRLFARAEHRDLRRVLRSRTRCRSCAGRSGRRDHDDAEPHAADRSRASARRFAYHRNGLGRRAQE